VYRRPLRLKALGRFARGWGAARVLKGAARCRTSRFHNKIAAPVWRGSQRLTALTRDIILSVFQDVATNQGRTLAPLEDDVRLTECGLDSLSFAIVVASLEDALGVDPFNSSEWVDFPVTLGDFVRLYDRAVA
jgi:Phosphopantetheine attachment site